MLSCCVAYWIFSLFSLHGFNCMACLVPPADLTWNSALCSWKGGWVTQDIFRKLKWVNREESSRIYVLRTGDKEFSLVEPRELVYVAALTRGSVLLINNGVIQRNMDTSFPQMPSLPDSLHTGNYLLKRILDPELARSCCFCGERCQHGQRLSDVWIFSCPDIAAATAVDPHPKQWCEQWLWAVKKVSDTWRC